MILSFAPAGGQEAPAPTQGMVGASGSVRRRDQHSPHQPKTLDISKGTTVVFSNSSATTHTASRAGSFHTGHIRSGHSVSVQFTQGGVYAYRCEIHPFMHGKIVVG